jgi:SAM-dependent methyltransferase
MSHWYRFLYRFGITPWESDTETLGSQIHELLDEEEERRTPPYGTALDVGCGTGRWSIAMAKRGWSVVGIDVVPRAIQSARHNARSAGVDVSFIRGDVAALREAGVKPGISFFLDVECFNHLDGRQRRHVGEEVDAVTTEDASGLLLTWRPARRGPLPAGADADDIADAFPGWQVAEAGEYAGEMPPGLRKAAPRWYRLNRS